MADSHGRFVWYELMTTDMEAAKTFYADVLGWGTQDVSVPGMAYTLFTAGGTSVSGLMDLPEDARKSGLRPSWLGYVGVSDVDAAADRIKELPPALDAPGRVGWHELLAADWEKAWAFYRELFGWQKAEADMGPVGTYQPFSAGGETIGGMFSKPAMEPVPFWLYYFNVGDIDVAMKRVKAGRGQILSGPVELLGNRWILRCTDPQGAIFALAGKRSHNGIGYFERVPRHRRIG